MVLLSVYTIEPNTSQQNHQLSLKKRNIHHRCLFQTDIFSFIRKLTKTTRPTANKEPTQEFKSTAVLPYTKGVSESLRRCLKQHGVLTVFKSDTTLRSYSVRPKDALEPTKQDGVVYKIPCECGKVYIGEAGKAMLISQCNNWYWLIKVKPGSHKILILLFSRIFVYRCHGDIDFHFTKCKPG